MTMQEEWRPVVSHTGLYEVSSLGSVRSLDRPVRNSKVSTRTERGRIMALGGWHPSYPYLSVQLSRDGRNQTFAVHRLVLEAFVGPCPPGMQCRHLNGDSTDNRAENLAWGTRMENAEDKLHHGTRLRGEEIAGVKLTSSKVEAIRERLALGHSQRSIAKDFGVGQTTISRIACGRNWRWLHGR